jgi:hypothetical protein
MPIPSPSFQSPLEFIPLLAFPGIGEAISFLRIPPLLTILLHHLTIPYVRARPEVSTLLVLALQVFGRCLACRLER